MFAAVAALVFAHAASAQVVSAYVLSTNTHLSNVLTGTTYSGTIYTGQYASFFASGIGGGVTFNMLPIGPVRLGVDFRGSTKPGTSGADTAMGGIRLGVKLPLVKPRPFVQVSGGYLAARTTETFTTPPGSSTTTVTDTRTNKYAAFEVIGGVDFPVFPFVDLRIEGGGGHGVQILGSSTINDSVNFFTINPGFVVRF